MSKMPRSNTSNSRRPIKIMFSPERMFHELEDAAEDMANLQAQAGQLTELKKSRLAALTLDYLKDCKSRVEAEVRALADPQYTEYITGMIEAERMANRAKAKYHNMRALGEARRTEESSRRALTR